jgi:asparagine synthase (glutamine-hydrolysing)
MGIIPLYIGWDQHGTFMASELKFEGYCTKIQLFPGHYMSKDGEFVQWYKRDGQNLMML